MAYTAGTPASHVTGGNEMAAESTMLKCPRCGGDVPISTLDFEERVKWLTSQMPSFPMPSESMVTNLIAALLTAGLGFDEFLVQPALAEGHCARLS